MTAKPTRRIAGITLIELMVAMAIGSFLMIGAITVFMQSRTTFRINESVGRMQENARYVVDALEPDLRMSHYWGLTSRTIKIRGRATPLMPVPAGLAVGNDCGVNWSINLDIEVGGTNNGYAWACAPFGAAQAGADTLEMRRVSQDPLLLLNAGTLYVQSARFRDGQIFLGPGVPAGFLPPPASATYQLRVMGFYVSANSSLDTPGNPVPSLRRKFLQGNTVFGPRIVDEEILPGVEDLQVQFGVDTDLEGTPNRGSIDRYVNPGDPIITPGAAGFLPDAQVLAIRLWVRVRAERPENGFTDTANYVYADRNVPPFNDAFRRFVVSKTIYLRNAMAPT